MKLHKIIRLLTFTCILGTLSACEKFNHDVLWPDKTDEGPEATTAVEPNSVQALSKHYVKVSFDGELEDTDIAVEQFKITDVNNQPLSIMEATPDAESNSVLISTSSQQEMEYNLEFVKPDASVSASDNGKSSFKFTGSTVTEPVLLTAIALDSNRVLLTFDQPMSDDTETIAYYRIVARDNNAPVVDVGDITITGASLSGDRQTLMLDTSDLASVEYELKATNITSHPESKLIHPSYNEVSFFGIAPVDNTPPTVTSIESPDAATIIITFSEPVDDTAADPAKYYVYSCAVEQTPCAVENQQRQTVTAAELNTYNTQVTLTTLPREANKTYTVEVTGVTDMSNNAIDISAGTHIVTTTFNGEPNPEDALSKPHLQSVVAISNTQLRINFSKPMSASAEDIQNYSVIQQNVNAEAGGLGLVGASFNGSDRTTVELITRSQSGLTYKLIALAVRDTLGQPISTQFSNSGFLRANEMEFAGIAPTASEAVDTDGDGVYDHEEQAGYLITVTLADGSVVSRQVTSNPDVADTDGDGVSDGDERQYASNPRSKDTDGDSLSDDLELNTIYSSPYKVDTDDDGLEDGLEHFQFKTSLLLADTDGDKFTDAEELFEYNRNPRIADIPKVDISVGEVYLQLDERYSYTDEEGNEVTESSSSSASLAQSNNTSFSRSDSNAETISGGFEISGGVSNEIGANGKTTVSAGFKGSFERSVTNSWQTDRTSARESQQAYQDSLNKGKTYSTSSSVSREVVGAQLDIDLSIENIGDVAFTVKNIEVTVLQRSPYDSRQFWPVATLVANSELISGSPLEVNIGPFNTQKGPFLFSSRDIFPNRVEALMAKPDGLVFEISNYDVVDEFGRNFSYSNQTVRDRTVGLVIDKGELGTERIYVATSGALKDDGTYEGGFNPDGSQIGITLDYVLSDILGYAKNSQVKSGVVAGVDGIADSRAGGDDIQLIPAGTTGLSPGAIVIDSGEDGLIAVTPDPADDTAFISGYATGATCNAQSGQKAGLSCAEQATNWCATPTPESADSASDVAAGLCNGPNKITRIDGLADGDYDRFWAVLFSGNLPGPTDFGQIKVRAGDDLTVAFVRDLDRDGLTARQEFLAGSTDSRVDVFDNSSFGNFTANNQLNLIQSPDGYPDSTDTDRDGIADFAEVRVGWLVNTEGALYRVFSSPRLTDTDGDALVDFHEQDLSRIPGIDMQRFDIANGGVIALDPTLPDTDQDGLNDEQEVNGAEVGLAVIDGGDGVTNTYKSGDDFQKAIYGTQVLPGSVLILPGPNAALESTPDTHGDDVIRAAYTVLTNPLIRDTDTDTMLDGLEVTQGSDPTVIDDEDFTDSDRDGLTDNEESLLGWMVSINQASPYQVFSSPYLADTDEDGLPDYVERDLGTDPNRVDTDNDGIDDIHEITATALARYAQISDNFPGAYLQGGMSEQLGTSPLLQDSDNDYLTDYQELYIGYPIRPRNDPAMITVYSNPLSDDTDGDGLLDHEEVIRNNAVTYTSEYLGVGKTIDIVDLSVLSDGEDNRSDPNLPDSDGDGIYDGSESSFDYVLLPNRDYTVAIDQIIVDNVSDASERCEDEDDESCQGNPTNHAEVGWWITVKHYNKQRQQIGDTVLLSSAADAYGVPPEDPADYQTWKDKLVTYRERLQFDDVYQYTTERIQQLLVGDNSNLFDRNWRNYNTCVVAVVGSKTQVRAQFNVAKREQYSLVEGDYLVIEGLIADLDTIYQDLYGCGRGPNQLDEPTTIEDESEEVLIKPQFIPRHFVADCFSRIYGVVGFDDDTSATYSFDTSDFSSCDMQGEVYVLD